MKNIIPCGIAVLSICVPSLAQASVVPGSEPKLWPANPARHVVSIKRLSKDDVGAKLIAAAEKLMPPDADVLAAVKKSNPDTVLVENQWWFKEELGVRIPFAITADAIDYYSAFVTNAGKQALQRYSEPGSSLTYEATVGSHDSFKLDGKDFEKVSVVTMSLRFSQNFVATTTEGMEFEKRRTVVFDKDGKVLHVSGDGETEVPVLAI